MKIRLIQPAALDKNGWPIKFRKLMMPTLALPTIAALTPDGIDVAITEEYIHDIDFEEDVDLVGITALTCQAPRAYQIANEFRRRGKKTIMGGSHATACVEEALRYFDSVLVGEAEDIWEQVLSDVRDNRLQRIYKSLERPDLSRMVIPRFDLVDFSRHEVPPFAKTPLIPIQATRGCPNQCDFCSVTPFLGHKIRTKPIANVMKEIETIKPSRIFFVDDNIGANPAYAEELFKALKPLKVRWACQLSTKISKHPKLIELAAKAGCYETFIGVESINEKSLKHMNKAFNKVEEYADLFRRFKEVGILPQAPLMLGIEGDTVDSIRKAVDTAMSWDINYLYLNIITPLPGTRFYERVNEESGFLSKDWSLYDTVNPIVGVEDMTSKELEDVMWESYRKFYSIKNIFKRLWRFKKQYVRFFPRDFFLEEVIFQLLVHKSVEIRKHPFSLGSIDNNKEPLMECDKKGKIECQTLVMKE